MDFLTLLGTVAPVFLVIVAGYAIFRAGWLTTEAEGSLLRLVVNLLYPCLILQTVMQNAEAMTPRNLLLPPLVGFCTVAVGFFCSYAAAPLFGVCDPRQRGTFAFTTGLYNYGYVALPVVQTVFGSKATAVLFVHNVGVEAALWTIGIMMLAGVSLRAGWKRLLSPPVLAIVSALALHFLGAHRWLPGFVLAAIKMLGSAAVPLGIVMTGATFADQARGLTAQPNAARISIGACVLRLGVLPLTLLALGRWLPCAPELRQVILVQAAMPSAVVPVILAKHFGGDPATALRIVFVTSALGLITIPLWLKVGLHVIHP